MVVLFVALTGWMMVLSLVLSPSGLDAEGVANAVKVGLNTVLASVVVERGLVRRHPAVALPVHGGAVVILCLALDLALVQVDALSVVVALGFAVVAVGATGGEAWWARSGRRGLVSARH